MTHTLHRVGSEEDLKGDYVMLMMAAQKINTEGSKEKLQQFLKMAQYNGAINCGDGREHCLCEAGDFDTVIGEIKDGVVAHAVFDSQDNLIAMLKQLKEEDLGISVVVSGLLEAVGECCHKAGIHPHTVNLSLGVHGKTERLADADALRITTMCGHGMITADLIWWLVKRIKSGAIIAEEAANQLGTLCLCGIFNTTRACAILKEMADKE